MGPRGVTAIYFTQRANAAAPHARTRAHLELHPPRPAIHPPTQNYDSTRSPRGWLWAQGYNLNCKKIKQILISSIATALQLLLTFIFISVTSGLIFSFFFFFFTHSILSEWWPHTLCIFALLNLLGNASCFLLPHRTLPSRQVLLLLKNAFRSPAVYYSRLNQNLHLATKATGITFGLWFGMGSWIRTNIHYHSV